MTLSRDELRRRFIAEHGWGDAQVASCKSDASHRRYFRLRRDARSDDTAMLMDAPPPTENAEAFVAVTRHLEKLGAGVVRVPAIYASDFAHGFLLLEDLGDDTFTKLLADGHDETGLYRRAIDTLIRIHRHPQAVAINLPAYTADLALGEANLLLDWYIPARLERPLGEDARAAFAQIWRALLAALPVLPDTLVLRDYHIDNLMIVGGECAVLDYQDAVIGSPGYDLVSLLEDARRDISPTLARDMTAHYLAQNPAIGERHRHALAQHCMVWGAQRHCKVAGIFTRLWLRDGKDVYLQHLPRVMKLLQRNLNQPALKPLRDWLHEHLGELNHIPSKTPAEKLTRHCAPA